MKTHRTIFWITLTLFIALLPLIFYIDMNSDIKNILIGIMCSCLVSSIIELPNLINCKNSIKNNLYNSLLYMKVFLLQYNNDIESRLQENKFEYPNYGLYFLNNISHYINVYNQTDETIFVNMNPNKKKFLESKNIFHNLYHSINAETLNVEISRIKVQLKEITIKDLHKQLEKVKANNNK